MKTIILTILLTVFFSVNCFAEDSLEAKAESKFDYLEAITHIEVLTDPVKRHLRKNNINLDFFGGVLQGYDNNVNLDPDRKKAGFLETSLDTEITYNYTDDIRLKVENYTTNVLYYDATDADLLDIYNKAGLEADIFDDMLTVGADYGLEFVIFPNDEDGTYLGNQAGIFIKHNISPNLYHKLGYKYLHKGFAHDKTLNSTPLRTSSLRKDNRHSFDYEAGFYFLDRAIIKTSVELYHNDSNYEYFKYYDFWSFKIKPSVILKIMDKLYASSSFSYRQRRYEDRRSSQHDAHVYDDTYSFNASLLYELTKSFTFAVNYSYRENVSNDPLQKYSGSIITGGLYYSF